MHFEKREFFELYDAFASLSLMPAPQNGWFLLTPVLKECFWDYINSTEPCCSCISFYAKNTRKWRDSIFFPLVNFKLPSLSCFLGVPHFPWKSCSSSACQPTEVPACHAGFGSGWSQGIYQPTLNQPEMAYNSLDKLYICLVLLRRKGVTVIQFILSKVLSFRDGKKKTSACQYGFVTFGNANPTRSRSAPCDTKKGMFPTKEGRITPAEAKNQDHQWSHGTLPQTNSSPPFQMLLLLVLVLVLVLVLLLLLLLLLLLSLLLLLCVLPPHHPLPPTVESEFIPQRSCEINDKSCEIHQNYCEINYRL